MTETAENPKPENQPPKKNPIPMIVAAIIAVAIIGGVVAALVVSDDGETISNQSSGAAGAGELPEVSINGPIPDTTFTYFDGTEGSFVALEGKPLVLNFFAAWCGPCITEMPDFEAAFQQVGNEVQFLGMNFQDDRVAADKIITETGVTYPVAEDRSGSIYEIFGGLAMPTTVFISADGDVLDVHSGIMTRSQLTQKIQSEFGL